MKGKTMEEVKEPENRPAAIAEKKDDPEAQKAAQRQKNHRNHMRALRSLLIRLAMLILVVYVLLFHLVGITTMPTADMYPRIDAGDLVLFYRLENTVHAQDVIVFRKPTASLERSYEEAGQIAEADQTAEKPWWRKALNWIGFADPTEPAMSTFICRVVAAPGDTVTVTEDARLLINGNSVIESGIFYQTPPYTGFVEYPITLGPDEYFVLADYRNGGADSRFFGAVRKDEILGTVITIMRRNNL